MIEPVGGYGGLEIYDLGVCKALADVGCDVTLYTCVNTGGQELEGYFSIKRVFGDMYNQKKNKLIRAYFFVIGLFKVVINTFKSRSDIIYCHIFTFSFVEFLILLTSALSNIKYVINIHDPVSFGKRNNKFLIFLFSKIFSKKNVFVTTHTFYSKKTLNKIFPSLPVAVMAYSDVDFLYKNSYSEASCRNEIELNNDNEYVIFFGQIKSSKGIDTLIEAWKIVHKINSNYRLLIVGRCWQNDCSKYVRQIESLGLGESVIWREEYVPDCDVHCYFKSSSLIVLPYTRIYSSAVLIRSLDYGKPVIVSDQEAFTEIVSDHETALVFKTGSAVDLSKKIIELLTDVELQKYLVENSKKLIERDFTWIVIGKKMQHLFDFILKQ
ncbi:MAG: glycosyltransferase family 4 protein [Bacteroidales bacterium]